jgi:hypothetical protein
MSAPEDWTAAEASAPFIARVAADAVARHERRCHAETQTCPHCGRELRIRDDRDDPEGDA